MSRQVVEQERDWLDRVGGVVENVLAICCVCVIGMAYFELQKDRGRN